MARTLAELQDKPRKRRSSTWLARRCLFCMLMFTPRSGMAAKHRTWCYEPACEEAYEQERRRAQDGRGGDR